jgi:hypothetical protein
MKSMSLKSASVIALGAGVLASCSQPREAPPPRPAPAPPARVVVPPTPAPPPVAMAWQDMPLTQGTWLYRSDASGSRALFGVSETQPRFSVRCDMAARRVVLSREGAASAGQITMRSSFSARNFPAQVSAEPLPMTSATVSPADPFLDSVAFSRGRFTVEAPGLPMLVLPSWPEPARVVEDCRS